MTNGKLQRSFLPLKLETTKINFFPLPWTIVHPIDEESPIYNVNEKEMNESEAEFIILVKAFDDTFSQNVFRRYSYKFDEIAWGYKFNIIFKAESDGVINLQINRFHEIEKVALN
jgi:inward rectifier potassium channel